MNICESVRNLENVRNGLDKFLNDPKNHNSPLADYLEKISLQCDKDARNLKEIYESYGNAI